MCRRARDGQAGVENKRTAVAGEQCVGATLKAGGVREQVF
jgi:hypothetical protein